MKKIEVCAPIAFVEPLRIELGAAGIQIQAGLTSACGLFRTDSPLGSKRNKTSRPTHCKVELIVSDWLAPRAITIITTLLHTHHCDAYLTHFVLLDVEGSYQFENASQPRT
jgi:hypothetical protein